MLGEPVGIGPQTTETRSVSHALNGVFTPLIQSLGQKMDNRELVIRLGPETRPEIYIENVKHDNGFTSKLGVLVDKFPSIYSFGDQEAVAPFTLSNPVVIKSTVGDYGTEWAKKFAFTGAVLVKVSVDPGSPINILEEAENANRTNRKLLDTYTQRHSRLDHVLYDEFVEIFKANMFGRELPKMGGSIVTFAEGVQTVVFVAGLLTHNKIEGYEDPTELLHALIEQGIFSDFSLRVPPAVTGILGRFGGVFTSNPVVRMPDGLLKLEHDLVAHFNLERSNFYADYNTGADKPLDRHGCPLGKKLDANDIAGVDMAARLFERVMQAQQQ